MKKKYDFSGWATRNDLKCSDGRTIRRDAFAENDGTTVPLVWQHQHNSPENVLGHALLENREEGVYAYCSFNNSELANEARECVAHGDIRSLSIYANGLKQKGGDVLHGRIREVSLVLSGANPGAYIDFPVIHGEEVEDECYICPDKELDLRPGLYVMHAETEEEKPEEKEEPKEEKKEMAESKEKTVKDVFDELTEEQKKVVYFMIGQALEDAKGGSDDEDDEAEHSAFDEGEDDMKYNVFDNEEREANTLSHADMELIISDAKRFGSLKESFLQHQEEMGIDNILYHSTTTYDRFANDDSYGIGNIDYLFPEAKNLNTPPDWIKRNDEWVSVVMGGVHHTPFSRIKSMFANITEEDARAKGYITGKMKKEEFFGLIKRTTTPTTVYKKQKLDRDDVVDITDFDVVAWLKSEMRMMLDEELARAYLIGDGRDASSEDKINPLNIRPIVEDEDLFTIKRTVSTANETDIKNFIKTIIRTRKYYKGSGSPVFFTTEDVLTEMLLLEDNMGHPLYADEAALAKKLRVSRIVPVEVMENATTTDGKAIYGIIVNLKDYNVGADKGGSINMFDDFDIDYNQMKYLIETRCSGALIKPFSAMAFLGAASGDDSGDDSDDGDDGAGGGK